MPEAPGGPDRDSGLSRYLRDLLRGIKELARDLRTLFSPGPRLIDQIEAVVSVLLAIALAQLIGARNVGWAAFSGYMVIRSHISASLQRAILRVLGTTAGALAGYAAAVFVTGRPFLASALLCVVVSATMYMVLVGRRTYAWLFTGLTFLMVVIDVVKPQDLPPRTFAISRVLEVLMGTAASLAVSFASSKTLRRWVPGKPAGASKSSGWTWHADAAWHALQAGVAASLIPLLSRWVAIPILTQAGITVMAVMAVPLANISPARNVVTTRIAHRFLGCSLGGLSAVAILAISHHNVALMTIGLCIGVAVGRHIENGSPSFGYVGVQFALAFLVVLVPDNYATASWTPGMERFTGIMVGFAVLALIRTGVQAVRKVIV